MSLRRSAVPLVSLTLAVVGGCGDPPTRPDARPRPAVASGAGSVVGQDLGVLPGDVASKATYVTGDGVVYGYSYAAGAFVGSPYDDGGTSGRRAFRWTPAGGMTAVSSIPAPPARPTPAVGTPPAPFRSARVRDVNAKGEAAGDLCLDSGCSDARHAFRYSSGSGIKDIDGRFTEGGEVDGSSSGQSINRWGHVAGAYSPSQESSPSAYLWTPVDSIRLVGGEGEGQGAALDGQGDGVRVNDVDQVVGTGSGGCGFAWRPDLGTRTLVTSGGACGDENSTFPRTQQAAGTLVVGSAAVAAEGGRFHAMLWRVPAVNRAAYPKVNASPITFTSTISIAKTGGRYFQFYKAPQSTAAYPTST